VDGILTLSIKILKNPTSINVVKDHEYCCIGNVSLKLDIYDPQNNQDERPAVIIIHGGGWRNGDKAGPIFRGMANFYTRLGFFAISVSYRLSSQAPAPAAIHDVKCAVRWLRAHSNQYKINVDQTIATGASAGGHLALMLGLSNDKELEGSGGFSEQSSQVAAVIENCGITDVAALLEGNDKREFAVEWLPEHLQNRASIAKLVSPIHHISRNSAPVLTFHGDADEVVPFEQSMDLHENLTRAGAKSKLVRLPGVRHGQWEVLENIGEILNQERISFLKELGILSSYLNEH
jgi:acetyl esterase/lipase